MSYNIHTANLQQLPPSHNPAKANCKRTSAVVVFYSFKTRRELRAVSRFTRCLQNTRRIALLPEKNRDLFAHKRLQARGWESIEPLFARVWRTIQIESAPLQHQELFAANSAQTTPLKFTQREQKGFAQRVFLIIFHCMRCIFVISSEKI